MPEDLKLKVITWNTQGENVLNWNVIRGADVLLVQEGGNLIPLEIRKLSGKLDSIGSYIVPRSSDNYRRCSPAIDESALTELSRDLKKIKAQTYFLRAGGGNDFQFAARCINYVFEGTRHTLMQEIGNGQEFATLEMRRIGVANQMSTATLAGGEAARNSVSWTFSQMRDVTNSSVSKLPSLLAVSWHSIASKDNRDTAELVDKCVTLLKSKEDLGAILIGGDFNDDITEFLKRQSDKYREEKTITICPKPDSDTDFNSPPTVVGVVWTHVNRSGLGAKIFHCNKNTQSKLKRVFDARRGGSTRYRPPPDEPPNGKMLDYFLVIYKTAVVTVSAIKEKEEVSCNRIEYSPGSDHWAVSLDLQIGLCRK